MGRGYVEEFADPVPRDAPRRVPPMPGAVVRTGVLRKAKCYLLHKPGYPAKDVYHMAPAGSLVEWNGEQSEPGDGYGDRTVLWVVLPHFGSRGVTEDEVEWDD